MAQECRLNTNRHYNYKMKSRFNCLQCDYKTNRIGNFLRHETIHEGVNFPCDQCDYKANQKEYLLVHTGCPVGKGQRNEAVNMGVLGL